MIQQQGQRRKRGGRGGVRGAEKEKEGQSRGEGSRERKGGPEQG